MARYLPYGITQCYLPPDNALRLDPSQTDRYLIYPEGMEGWVDLGSWLYTEMVYCPQTDTYLSTPPILVKGSRDPSVRSQRHFSILIST